MERVFLVAKKHKQPEFSGRLILKTDASKTGVEAALLQENEKRNWVPVQWASRKLSEAEIRYGIAEK
jgi:hypothetical protein